MDKKVALVAAAMMKCNMGDARRIEHSMKVFAYAQTLGCMEGLSAGQQLTLELTALLHDIGIHMAERKFGISSSTLQESEGPPVAREILVELGFDEAIVERVCYIISKHHTFTAIDDEVFQLLVEADFLVNSVEDVMSEQQIVSFARNIFKTQSGLKILYNLFPKYIQK